MGTVRFSSQSSLIHVLTLILFDEGQAIDIVEEKDISHHIAKNDSIFICGNNHEVNVPVVLILVVGKWVQDF